MDEIEENKLALFNIKQKFLREIPHHKLILKSINQLKQKYNFTIATLPTLQTAKLSAEQTAMPLVDFLNQHIQNSLNCKHQISLTQHPNELVYQLIDLLNIQLVLIVKLNAYLPQKIKRNADAIKISVPIDTYFILKTISALNIEEKEIKNYLYTALNDTNKELTPLAIVFMRIHKIVVHG